MNDLFLFPRDTAPEMALTGEVIYESVLTSLIEKKLLKKYIYRSILQHLRALPDVKWATYLVILSSGQEHDEVRCQVDIETDGGRAGFAVGFGHRPNYAFSDAAERMQWYEKNEPIRMIV